MYTKRPFQLVLLAICVLYAVDASRIENIAALGRLMARAKSGVAAVDAAVSAVAPAATADSKATEASGGDSKDSQETASAAAQAASGADSKATTAAAAAAKDTGKAAAKTTAAAAAAKKTSAAANAAAKTTAADAAKETKAAATESSPEQTSAADNTEHDAATTSAPETTEAAKKDDAKKSKSEEDRKPVTSTFVSVITKTNADGSKKTMTTTTKTTSTPGLNSEGESGGSSGMTHQTRSIIIGVVVGVGGAIILGALALVALRIRRKRKIAEETDGLMAYQEPSSTGYHNAYGMEKHEHGSHGGSIGSSHAGSALDRYHTPGPVNASSNF